MKRNFYTKIGLFTVMLILSNCLMAESEAVIEGPVKANWQNPMLSNPPEDLQSGAAIIELNIESTLIVNLTAITTNSDLTDFDDLYISYVFGEYSDDLLITNSDLVDVGEGFFEATFELMFNFNDQCEIEPDGVLEIPVLIRLSTPKAGGGFAEYPIVANPDLFDPEKYEGLLPGFSAEKFLLCAGAEPRSNMNDDEIIVEIDHSLEELKVYPNPFSNVIQIEYFQNKDSDVQLLLIDSSGKTVLFKRFAMQRAGINQQRVEIEQNLHPGIYTLQLICSNHIKNERLVYLTNN